MGQAMKCRVDRRFVIRVGSTRAHSQLSRVCASIATRTCTIYLVAQPLVALTESSCANAY